MKTELAILGGHPAFEQKVQPRHHLPSWEQYEQLITGIFDRRYYTNHGPLAVEFEKRFREFFGVSNALYMTNAGIGIMITTTALELRKKVIVPAFTHVSVAQALMWAGAQPVYCDVDRATMHFDMDKLAAMIDGDTCAILGVNSFGGTCAYEAIEEIAAKNSIVAYYLSDDAIGQQYKNRKAGNFGKLEIFSLHETKMINAVNGCVVTCNDDALAEKIRHIRSSYGLGKPTPVPFTGNGRMSEIVAGMALMGLDKFDAQVKANKSVHEAYANAIGAVSGLQLYLPDSAVTHRNYHRTLVRVDAREYGLDASELNRLLRAENFYTAKLSHYALNAVDPPQSLSEHTVAAELAHSVLELPMDTAVMENNGPEKLADRLIAAKQSAHSIKSQLVAKS